MNLEGWEGLQARPVGGRPSKLNYTREKIVLRWLRGSATDFGFPTELWTAKRLAYLIREAFGVEMNVRYLSSWLRARQFTPQIPNRIPRERDEDAIAQWVENDWRRIKKKRSVRGQISHSSTKADS